MTGSFPKRLLLLVGVLSVAGTTVWYRSHSPTISGTSHVVTVHRATMATTVQATGRVQASRQVELSLPAGGEVLTVRVQAGDSITAGTVLLTLDPTGAEQRVREAEANLSLHKIALDRARTGSSGDEIEAARARLQQSIVARQAAQAAYDKIAGQPDAGTRTEAVALARAKAEEQAAQNAFRRAVHGAPPDEIASLEQQVTLAQIGLDRARRNLDGTRLVAPFAGTVMAIRTHPHERVNPTQPLVTLADLSTLLVTAQVDETDIRTVVPGQPAEIRLDAAPGRVISGTVNRVAPAASSQRGATTFQTEIRLDAPAHLTLRPGMNADVMIVTSNREDVLVIPREAVQQIGSKETVTLIENGRRRKVEVVTGVHNTQQVEIVKGLQEEQKVVVP